MKVTLKDLLIMLDMIIFAHVRFHKAEYGALLGTDVGSRDDLKRKIINYIIDSLSDGFDSIEIELSDTDLTNLLGYSNPYHFEPYIEYEKRGRFKKEDIEELRERLIQIKKSGGQ